MKYIVTLKDKTYEVEVEEGEAMILDEYEAKAPAAPASGTAVPAPLPGNVLSIKVNQGDSVAEGDVLLVIEAMKMENEVAAPCAGTVQQISVSVGQMVNTGDTLVVL